MSNRYRVVDGYTIDPEKRALWTAALRSGDYEQGRRVLTRVRTLPDGTVAYQHCCLGVACELASAAGAVERVESSGWDTVHYGAPENELGYREEVLLPKETSLWLDLRRDGVPLGPDGDVLVIDTQTSHNLCLSTINDQGVSFDDIADIIDTIPDNPTTE